MAQEPEIDVGAITEALNNKTDTDVQNTTTIGSAQIAHLASPSNYTSNLTWGASGAHYTAPDDGWIVAARVSSAGSQVLAIETYNPELTKKYYAELYFFYGSRSAGCSDSSCQQRTSHHYPIQFTDSGRISFCLQKR